MDLCIFATVDMLVFFCLCQQLYLRVMPQIFGYNGFMLTIHQQVIVLLYKPVIVSCTMHLFCPASAVGDFAAVHRIFQDSADEGSIKQRPLTILALDFIDAVVGKVSGETVCAHVGMHILIENHTDRLGFILVDKQLTLFQCITIGSEAPIPFALTGFLDSALHGLHTDVLTFDLCDRRQDRDHQLSCILGGINAVLNADQIDTEVLHDLQGGQHIRRVSAEAGELEHQHIGDTILASSDVLHHLTELRSALNGLARFARVLILPNDLIFIVVSKGFHSGLLCIQRVSIHLYRGGDSCIGIYFYFVFFHIIILIRDLFYNS